MSSKFPRIEGQRAINVFRVASAGVNAQVVVIGADTYELATRDDLAVTAGHIPVDLTGGATRKAKAKLTFTGQPSDTETITINGKVYTFQTTLTQVDGHVLISAVNAEGTIDNLVAAINGGAGRGIAYGTPTVTNTICTAAKSSTDKCILSAIIAGTPGNAYTLAEAATNVAKDATTFGTEQLGVDPTADDVSDAMVATINAETTEDIVAREIGDNEFMIMGRKSRPMVLTCTETLTGSNNAWAASAMYGGSLTKNRRMAVASRVPTAVEVALGNMHFELDFTPATVLARVRVTTTPGVDVAWDGAVTISGGHVVLDNAGSTDWSASHTLEVIFIE
jgi:hypothetical protein